MNCRFLTFFTAGFFLSAAQYGFGQTKIDITLSGGVGVPTGSFASGRQNYLYADGHGKTTGLAKPGGSVELSMAYRCSHNIALDLLVSGTENKVDASAFQNNLKNLYATSDNYTVSVNSWKILRVMVGVDKIIVVSSNRNIFLYPKLLLGVQKTSIPAYSYINTTNFSEAGQQDKVSLPAQICIGLGSDVSFNLSKMVFLNIDLNYLYAAGAKGTKSHDYSGSSFTTTNNVPVSAINLLLGIGFHL